MKKLIMVCVAGALAMVAQAFDAAEKTAIRQTMQQVEAQLKNAVAINGKPVLLLPVRGDDGAFAEELLLGALIRTGKTPVVSNDEQTDARFKAILKKIRWDERMTTLKAVDPATVDQLGQLKSAQIFLEAKLDIDRSARRPAATLSLLAYAVATKQYVWSADVTPVLQPVEGALPKAFVRPAKAPLHVAVVSTGSAATVAAQMATQVRSYVMKNALGVVDAKTTPDVTVTLETASSEFDRTGNWYVLEGTTKLGAKVAGGDARQLAETELTVRGTRALGLPAAQRALVSALFKQTAPWLKETLSGEVLGIESVAFALERGEAVETAADVATAEAVRKALAAMEGVRRAEITEQDNAKGFFAYRVVYEKSRYAGGFLNAAFMRHADLFKPFEKR